MDRAVFSLTPTPTVIDWGPTTYKSPSTVHTKPRPSTTRGTDPSVSMTTKVSTIVRVSRSAKVSIIAKVPESYGLFETSGNLPLLHVTCYRSTLD